MHNKLAADLLLLLNRIGFVVEESSAFLLLSPALEEARSIASARMYELHHPDSVKCDDFWRT